MKCCGWSATATIPLNCYEHDGELKSVIDAIALGQFSQGDKDIFAPLVESLLTRDEYMLLADFRSYVTASETAAYVYQDRSRWTKMSILNTARCGFFSSDRTIREYCDEIWHVKPLPVQ